MTQWLRKITVEYGRQTPEGDYGPPEPWTITSEGDSDYRIQFRFSRTNTSNADTGTINIFNLPPEFLDSIRSGVNKANADRRKILDLIKFKNDLDARNGELRELALANLVKIYAGYQDSTKLIFTGDITAIDINSMRSDVDIVTRIDLGDMIIPLKYGWLNKTFAGNSSVADILVSVMGSLGVSPSEMAKRLQNEATVGVELSQFKNGLIIMGGVKRSIDALVARYGVQWFVRDGEYFLMARGALIDDFSLTLQLGENVLRPVSDIDGDSVSFTMLIDGDMLPGRGFRILDEFGKPTSKSGYRADTVQYVGDTHGNPWYCIVEGISIDGKGFPPATTITPDQAFTTTNVAVPA